MSIPLEALLGILVAVAAVGLILQSLFMVRVARSATELVSTLETSAKALDNEVQKLLTELQEVTSRLEPLGRVSEQFSLKASEFNRLFGERTQDLDRLLEELIAVSRKQAAKIDEVVTDTVEKFEETTTVIQEDLLRPVVEVSSFVKGMKTGFEYLFSRKKVASSDKASSEEDLFI